MSVVFNIISTVNGMENEGMRNIASHMIREFDGMCTVRTSPLNDPVRCIKNTIGADAVLIFARASAKTAYLARALHLLCKKVYFILVQKPEPAFISKMGNAVKKLGYFTILPKDGEELAACDAEVHHLYVGINTDKFRPAESRNEILDLRRKYGVDPELPLVVHVGHLSEGRGLEKFLHLPKERYSRLIVASGMFNSDEVESKLMADGVTIIKEYLPDVSEIYRMADVYLFPTRSAEFVISIPLSVMESLACGTPVVSFDGVGGIDVIRTAEDDALVKLNDSADLEAAVTETALRYKDNCRNLLRDAVTWHDSAVQLYGEINNK